jgi:hypothetical protein
LESDEAIKASQPKREEERQQNVAEWRKAEVNMGRLVIVLVIFVGAVSTSAQHERPIRKNADRRIIKSVPSVFISYDHEGKREPFAND